MTLKPADPQAVVLFGASGDLTRRKLIPAFWHLFVEGLLPQGFAVVGYARTEMKDEEFHELAADSVKEGQPLATPLAQSGLLEDDVVEMIAVGESANNLDEVLLNMVLASKVTPSTSRRLSRLYVKHKEVKIKGLHLVLIEGDKGR